MKRLLFNYNIFYVYLLSIPLYAIYNHSGYLPLSLLVSVASMFAGFFFFCIGGKGRGIIYSLNYFDLFMVSFLLFSVVGIMVGIGVSNGNNINHFIAYWVVYVFYYFAVKVLIFNSPLIYNQNKLLDMLLSLFWFTSILAVMDYVLLNLQINLMDIIPALHNINRPVMGGLNSRPRGLLPEATDLALLLNIVAPIVLVYLLETGRDRHFVFAFLIYLLLVLLVRSSAGIAGLSLGIVFGITDFLIRKKYLLCRYKIKPILIVAAIFSLVYYLAIDVFSSNLLDVLSKIMLQKESPSVDDRIGGWMHTLGLFMASPNLFVGYGAGYLSANDYISHNWYLTVLVEFGLIGIVLLFAIVLYLFYKIYNMKTELRFGFYVSFIAVLVHFFTYSGFYHAHVWLLFVLISFPWKKNHRNQFKLSYWRGF